MTDRRFVSNAEDDSLKAQLNELAKKAGFESYLEAPPAINGLLIRTYPQSPLADHALVGFLNKYRPKDAKKTKPYTLKQVHEFCVGLAKGVNYIASRYPNVKIQEYFIGSEIEYAPNQLLGGFAAAFTACGEKSTLIIDPRTITQCMQTKLDSPSPSVRTITYAPLRGQLFNADEYAIIIGLEESFHAHQYYSGTMREPLAYKDGGTKGDQYETDPDEIEAKKAVAEAVKELGLGSLYAGRRK